MNEKSYPAGHIWHGLGVFAICTICTTYTEKLYDGSGCAGIPGGFWREDRCLQQTSTAGVKEKQFAVAIVSRKQHRRLAIADIAALLQ